MRTTTGTTLATAASVLLAVALELALRANVHQAPFDNGLFLVFLAGAICLAGLPLTGGFFSKDGILLALLAGASLLFRLGLRRYASASS